MSAFPSDTMLLLNENTCRCVYQSPTWVITSSISFTFSAKHFSSDISFFKWAVRKQRPHLATVTVIQLNIQRNTSNTLLLKAAACLSLKMSCSLRNSPTNAPYRQNEDLEKVESLLNISLEDDRKLLHVESLTNIFQYNCVFFVWKPHISIKN